MDLTDKIERFSPITTEQINEVKLMNKVDIKYVFNNSILPDLLEKISDDYFMLIADEVRISRHITLYFDTKKNQLYLHHHNGKRNRYKVRYRECVESGITFFEIKYKNNKGRIIKDRIKVDAVVQELGEEELALLRKKVNKKIKVEPRLESRFKRIILVAKEGVERVTLDFNLSFVYNKETEGSPSLAIAEVKQERYSRSSKIMSILREYGVRPGGMSKYAIGMSIFSGEKANNFKEKRIKINKIIADDN